LKEFFLKSAISRKKMILATTRSSECSGNTPCIWFFELVVQRLELLLLLLHRELRRVSSFEEAWSELDEPFRVDCCHFSHVLFAGENELVIDAPVRLAVEHGRRGMDENLLLVDKCTVSVWVVWIRIKYNGTTLP